MTRARLSALAVGVFAVGSSLIVAAQSGTDGSIAAIDVSVLARHWVATASTGLGDGPELSTQLTFTDVSAAHAVLVVSGCTSSTSDVTLQPGNELSVAPRGEWGTCASSFDNGQAMPEFFRGPVSWTVSGDQLTLSSGGGASLTLVARDS